MYIVEGALEPGRDCCHRGVVFGFAKQLLLHTPNWQSGNQNKFVDGKISRDLIIADGSGFDGHSRL